MKSGGQIRQEAYDQGYCIMVRGIWEKNNAMVGGMKQAPNA
jgi:hypothetical protein